MNLKQAIKVCVVSMLILIMAVTPLWAAEVHQGGDTNVYLPVVSDNSAGSAIKLQSASSSNSYYEENVSQGGIMRNATLNTYSEIADPGAGRNCPAACNEWHRGYYIFDISEVPVSLSVSNLSLPYVGRYRNLAWERYPITVYAFEASNFESLSAEGKYNQIGSGTMLGTITFDETQTAVLSVAMQNLLGDAIETYRSQNEDQLGIGIQRSPESDEFIKLWEKLPILEFDYEPTELCLGLTPTHYGTEGDDVINGTSDMDVIHGLGGNDIINGKGGPDIICGGPGENTIDGGNGNDRIYGGDDTNTIRGGWGNDTIVGGSERDEIYGGYGWDIISGEGGDDYIEGNDGRDQIDGGEGLDRLHGGWKDDIIRGGPGNDYITGGKGADKLYGEAGNDDLFGQGGRDDLDGGSGTDDCNGGAGNDDFVNCE